MPSSWWVKRPNVSLCLSVLLVDIYKYFGEDWQNVEHIGTKILAPSKYKGSKMHSLKKRPSKKFKRATFNMITYFCKIPSSWLHKNRRWFFWEGKTQGVAKKVHWQQMMMMVPNSIYTRVTGQAANLSSQLLKDKWYGMRNSA